MYFIVKMEVLNEVFEREAKEKVVNNGYYYRDYKG